MLIHVYGISVEMSKKSLFSSVYSYIEQTGLVGFF